MLLMLENVSIIIPIAHDETAHEILLNDLKYVQAEIICSSERSRAKSMNEGAKQARNDFLWFLHADSRISKNNIIQLEQSLKYAPDALHYLDLAFDSGGLTIFNAWGANMRSRIFGVPYGDQGFCISKQNFYKAGQYIEDIELAEDLMFVWQVRQKKIKLKNIPSPIITSARKYKAQGWLKLTAKYQWIWIKLSIPEAWKLIRGKR